MTPVEEAYLSQHNEVMGLMKALQDRMVDMPAPDGDTPINWGHVGTVAEVRNKLEMVLEFLG
jgi:hypothetical protein